MKKKRSKNLKLKKSLISKLDPSNITGGGANANRSFCLRDCTPSNATFCCSLACDPEETQGITCGLSCGCPTVK